MRNKHKNMTFGNTKIPKSEVGIINTKQHHAGKKVNKIHEKNKIIRSEADCGDLVVPREEIKVRYINVGTAGVAASRFIAYSFLCAVHYNMVFYKCCFVFLLCVASFAECLNVITRSEWGARAPKWAPTPLSVNPASHVIIHHGDSNPCTTRDKCMAKVKIYQTDHINNRRWSDIGYNFVVGEDGNVYEGRGWGKQGSHAAPYNEKSIGISVIGRFDVIAPNSAALNAVQELIQYGVNNGKIQSNYKLVGHRQVKGTKCPGQAFYDIIKTWPNYASTP